MNYEYGVCACCRRNRVGPGKDTCQNCFDRWRCTDRSVCVGCGRVKNPPSKYTLCADCNRIYPRHPGQQPPQQQRPQIYQTQPAPSASTSQPFVPPSQQIYKSQPGDPSSQPFVPPTQSLYRSQQPFSSSTQSPFSPPQQPQHQRSFTTPNFTPPQFQQQGGLSASDIPPQFQPRGGQSTSDIPPQFQPRGGPITPGAPPQFQTPGAPPQFQTPGAPPQFQTPGAPPQFQTPGAPTGTPRVSDGASSVSVVSGEAGGVCYLLPQCPEGTSCRDCSEEHLTNFSHPDISERRVCPTYKHCVDFSVAHRRAFAHPPYVFPFGNVQNLNVCDPRRFERNCSCPLPEGITPSDVAVDFDGNLSALERKLDEYMSQQDRSYRDDVSHLAEITEMFESMRYVHSMSGNVLTSVARLGYIFALEDLLTFWTDYEGMARTILGDKSLRPVMQKYKAQYGALLNYTTLVVQDKEANIPKEEGFPERLLQFCIPLDRKGKEIIDHQYQIMSEGFEEQYLDMIDKRVEEVVSGLESLACSGIGISCDSDRNTRVDYTAFSILGVNEGIYGNHEVAMILNPDITCHPDFYYTLVAATGYCGGTNNWYRKIPKYGLDRTPWMGEAHRPKTILAIQKDDLSSMKDFFHEKYSPLSPGWARVVAKEFMCRAYFYSRSKEMYEGKFPLPFRNLMFKDITKEHIMTLLRSRKGYGAHFAVEGHIPSRTPASAAEFIVIRQDVYDKVKENPHVKALFSQIGLENIIRVPVVNPVYDKKGSVSKENMEAFHQTICDVAQRPLKPKNMSSFTFNLANLGKGVDRVTIPKYLDGEAGELSFYAVGGSFVMSLSNCFDEMPTATDGTERVEFKFTFNASTHLFFVEKDGVQGTLATDKSLLKDQFVKETDVIRIIVSIHFDKGLLCIRIGPGSTHPSVERFVFREIPTDTFRKPRYVSFLSVPDAEKNVCIWNVSYAKKS